MNKISLTLLLLVSMLCGCATGGSQSSVGENINYALDEKLIEANKAYREARLSDAERLYREISEAHPSLVEVWVRLGNIYTRLGQYDAAVRAYETALRYDPDEGRAWYNLSLVYLKKSTVVLEQGQRTVSEDSPYLDDMRTLHRRLVERTNATE